MVITSDLNLTDPFGHFLSQLRWAESRTASDFLWNYGSDTLLQGASATRPFMSAHVPTGLVFLKTIKI